MSRKRKLYIPITRSGSSILASIFTQLLQEARRQRRAKIDERVARGEISKATGEIYKHPCLIWFLVWLGVMLVYLVFVVIEREFRG